MLKPLIITCLTTVVVLISNHPLHPAIADTCASNCRPNLIQFIPGQRVTVYILNRTASIVLVQRIQGTDPIPVQPGQQLRFDRWGGTRPNISMVFWDETSLPLLARITKPATQTLRVEVVPGGRPPGDRALYIANDGRVLVF